MKKILIPTDFSENAKKATDYALSLFNEKNTVITLLNTFYIPTPSLEIAYNVTDLVYDNSKKLFEKELERIKMKFPKLKSTIFTRFEIGDPVSVVASFEKVESFNLIVMGTKGASGFTEALIGSRTSDMVKTAKAPLLIVPENAPLNMPKRILFAADEDLIEQEINLTVLTDLAKKNNSKIEAIHISDNDENKEIIEVFIDFELDLNFVDIPHELNVEKGKDVEKAIQLYTENYPIDLIAMVSTKGNMFYNLFHKSITKKMAMHTKIPLLIVHTNLKK